MSEVQNLEAEKSVLGAMILSPRVVDDVADIVQGYDFYSPANETIFKTILRMSQDQVPIEFVTLTAALEAGEDLRRVGGFGYLNELVEAPTSPASATYYAQLVADRAIRRRLVAAGQKIQQLGGTGADAEELVEIARREVDQSLRAGATAVQFFGETVDEMLGKLEENIPAVATPWESMNKIIGGLRPGALYVVGARPSVGKSVVALQLAKALATTGSVAFVSLEMTADDVQKRAVSSDLHIDISRIMDAKLTPGDWAKIRERRPKWAQVPLAILDNSAATITDIKRFARSVHRRTPLAGIVVDYLQLMSPGPGDRRERHEFVADMSRQLKILAMDLQVPVIALSQLNRGSEGRESREPRLSDLRESGAIEQDADVVILLHREIMGDLRSEIAMLVAKNRHGSTNVAHLAFWGHYSEIREKSDSYFGAVAA
jgi:replicative DNA helicase